MPGILLVCGTDTRVLRTQVEQHPACVLLLLLPVEGGHKSTQEVYERECLRTNTHRWGISGPVSPSQTFANTSQHVSLVLFIIGTNK